jgi:N-acetylmuramoyl-L-alanine amidase
MGGRVAARALALALAALLLPPSPASSAPRRSARKPEAKKAEKPAPRGGTARVELGDGLVAALGEDHAIFLEAVPRRGEGLLGFARRLCGDSRLAHQLVEANRGLANASGELVSGTRYRVPFVLLSPERQLQVTRALFPEDKPLPDGWRHKARGVGVLEREGLWHLSSWFTGNGENFRAIREYNELPDDDVPRGTEVTIPAELLLPAFRGSIPAAATSHQLDYGKDDRGEYAIYRLRPGEALYSSVVVRFTDRVFGTDVNALATEIASRSGIADVTDIPIGYRVKVPFDVLRPEFLPANHPRRVEYEASLRASTRFSNPVRSRSLQDITVILDAGHGGRDSGATPGGIWESLYVYDIAVRTKHLLEQHTQARVVATTRDGDSFRIAETDVLPVSRGHAVLTTPPYPIEDAAVGVNLRWYLANSVFRKAASADKVVFLSIHADSLHPSVRGVMAYIPAAALRSDSYGKSGAVYHARREVQEKPRVRFTWDLRVKSEGLSRELAKQMIAAFEEEGLAVHPFKPVREKIVRNGSEWVPAVLRYNEVPAKILLEVCNLANDQDRRQVQTRAFRQKAAEAIVRGLLAYYGQEIELPTPQVAKTK